MRYAMQHALLHVFGQVDCHNPEAAKFKEMVRTRWNNLYARWMPSENLFCWPRFDGVCKCVDETRYDQVFGNCRMCMTIRTNATQHAALIHRKVWTQVTNIAL